MIPMLRRTFLPLSLIAPLLCVPAPSQAEEKPGPQAVPPVSASATISATTPRLVRISDLDDIALGSWSGHGDLVGGDSDICIWSTTQAYRITAVGNGPEGSFQLNDRNDHILPYLVTWIPNRRDPDQPTMTANMPVGPYPTTHGSQECEKGNLSNAGIALRIPEPDLILAPAGTYTGTLTLLVSAE